MMSYTKAIKKAQRESVETTFRKRRLVFAGAVVKQNNERLLIRVMFGAMALGENPGSGRPAKNWHQRLVDDLVPNHRRVNEIFPIAVWR